MQQIDRLRDDRRFLMRALHRRLVEHEGRRQARGFSAFTVMAMARRSTAVGRTTTRVRSAALAASIGVFQRGRAGVDDQEVDPGVLRREPGRSRGAGLDADHRRGRAQARAGPVEQGALRIAVGHQGLAALAGCGHGHVGRNQRLAGPTLLRNHGDDMHHR